MKSEPLRLMYTIPLKGVTDFSTTSLMGEILKGYTFRFYVRWIYLFVQELPPSSVP